MAVLRSAGKSQTIAFDLGEAQHWTHRADHVSLRSQRRLLGPEAASGLAVESSAGRYEVVARRASRVSAPAFSSSGRLLVGAEFAHTARCRPRVDGDYGARWRRTPARRRCRPRFAEPPVCVDWT